MEEFNKNEDIQEKSKLESSEVARVVLNTNEASKEEKEVIVNQRKEEDQAKLKERLAEINKFFDEKNEKFNGQPYIPNAETNRLTEERNEIEVKLNS